MGMPTWVAAGDPSYQIWMSHTPPGTVIDNLTGQTREINQHIGYSGDVFSMYTHCGTHIDTLNHWGYAGEIWNHFTASRASRQPALDQVRRRQVAPDHRPRRDARRGGDQRRGHAARQLPDHARGPAGDRSTGSTIRLEEGDVVLIRTGRMTVWDDPQRFLMDGPGINVRAAQWLVEGHGAMIVGADQATVEYQPATDVPGHFLPVHLYLLAEHGRADDGDRVPGGVGPRPGLRVRLLRRAAAPARRDRLAAPPLGDAAAQVSCARGEGRRQEAAGGGRVRRVLRRSRSGSDMGLAMFFHFRRGARLLEHHPRS